MTPPQTYYTLHGVRIPATREGMPDNSLCACVSCGSYSPPARYMNRANATPEVQKEFQKIAQTNMDALKRQGFAFDQTLNENKLRAFEFAANLGLCLLQPPREALGGVSHPLVHWSWRCGAITNRDDKLTEDVTVNPVQK